MASRTLIGAAASGETADAEPQLAPPPPSPAERTFRLRRDETVSDGIRRAARGRLADSSAALATASGEDELAAAVHHTRKSVKRVRGALRLARDAIGDETYRQENDALRAVARSLAGARDAQVMTETLAALERCFPDELAAETTQRLRERLDDERVRETATLAVDDDLAVATRQSLEDARARSAGWSFERDGFDALAPGLKRVYRHGRKRMRAACDEPSAENLHDTRKRVKDLWHAAELLRPADPKRMKRLAKDAHALASLLGDRHDLDVLRDYAEANPQLFAAMSDREALLAAIDRRAEPLQRRALKAGRKLYERSPKRFVKDVARGWDKRVGAPQA